MTFDIRTLSPTDNRATFSSGDAELDRYFLRFAGENQFRHHVGVNYVAVEQDRILGFVNVAAAEIRAAEVSATVRKQLPSYPLPALRIARLAVDEQAQQQGLGNALVRFSFTLALRMRDELGCVGVAVDAKPGAIAFYARFGFANVNLEAGQLGDRPEPTLMVLPIAAIAVAP